MMRTLTIMMLALCLFGGSVQAASKPKNGLVPCPGGNEWDLGCRAAPHTYKSAGHYSNKPGSGQLDFDPQMAGFGVNLGCSLAVGLIPGVSTANEFAGAALNGLATGTAGGFCQAMLSELFGLNKPKPTKHVRENRTIVVDNPSPPPRLPDPGTWIQYYNDTKPLRKEEDRPPVPLDTAPTVDPEAKVSSAPPVRAPDVLLNAAKPE